LPQTLSHAEVRRILAAVRNPIHRGCFSLIYGCGLRISEAAALPVTAIDKTSGVLRVVGKGNKERVVPVPKEVHQGLRRMWQAKDHRDPRWLFPNGWRTGPVATHVLTRTFAEAVKAANLPSGRRATPHRCVTPMQPGSSRTRSTPASSRRFSATRTSPRRRFTRT
jgi:site-specific recombinase XerD